MVTTKTDAAVDEWAIDDDVIRLRLWGTEHIHPLPAPPIDEWIIGSDPACALVLDDPRVSRRHARLVREDGRWILRDEGSKNGLRFDGVRHDWFALEPCVEIGIGGATLIAESARSIALRTFIARILGWASDRAVTVDHALRSLRMAAARRCALVIRGRRDLVPIAHALHRHAFGADRPFVVCDPRRQEAKESVRAAANYESAAAAFEAAADGSLCVWDSRLPRDFPDVLDRFREPEPRVRLIVCSPRRGGANTLLAVPIEVPPLAGRTRELRRIVEAYGLDALAELGAPRSSFTAADRDWVLAHEARSLADIEKATLRLVALRTAGNVNRAAARLGMAHVSLARWIGRRKLPIRAGGSRDPARTGRPPG
jgi:hypothetical protein